MSHNGNGYESALINRAYYLNIAYLPSTYKNEFCFFFYLLSGCCINAATVLIIANIRFLKMNPLLRYTIFLLQEIRLLSS